VNKKTVGPTDSISFVRRRRGDGGGGGTYAPFRKKIYNLPWRSEVVD